jgi:hypothetical protein
MPLASFGYESLEFDLISVQLRVILCLIQQNLQLDYQDVLPFHKPTRIVLANT